MDGKETYLNKGNMYEMQDAGSASDQPLFMNCCAPLAVSCFSQIDITCCFHTTSIIRIVC